VLTLRLVVSSALIFTGVLFASRSSWRLPASAPVSVAPRASVPD